MITEEGEPIHPGVVVTTHHDGLGLNDRITINADARDPENGGASHHYDILVDARDGDHPFLLGELHFQHGPREGGINGITDQAVLAVLLDRYRGFQEGPLACRENALVITKLEEAMHWMQHRARERAQRGVLGKSER